jgi:hypothetical protein
MRRKSISIEENKKDEFEEDSIFYWVDEVEKKPVKKSVSFSSVVNLCLIETRKELDFASLNLYMNDDQYNLIRNEFKQEVETFVKLNPQYKMKSRDEMTKNICEFVEQRTEIISS